MKKRRQLLDSSEEKACSSKTAQLIDGQGEMDQEDQAEGISGTVKFVQGQSIVAAKNMRSIAVQTEGGRKTPEGLWNKRPIGRETDKAEGERKDEGLVQDQIILSPEMMSIVLEHLNLRTLKQVRLVCKSWLLEAQAHIKRKGIVSLVGDTSSATIVLDFMETRYSKIPALPQPFKSVSVNLTFSLPKDEYSYSRISPQSDAALRQLSKLCPPLLITRLSTEGLPPELAYPLISQHAPNLEYLKLFAGDCRHDGRNFSLNSQDIKFLKLRHLDVYALLSGKYLRWDGFPHFVAWILEASPNLDVFKLVGGITDSQAVDQSNKVLDKVDLRHVTTLKLYGFDIYGGTLNRSPSISYDKLKNLSMKNLRSEASQALITIATKAALSLEKLNLQGIKLTSDAVSEFPVCSAVQELHLELFSGWQNFVSRCFPSLQDFGAFLNASSPLHRGNREEPQVSSFRNDEEIFPANVTFEHVKTLKIQMNHWLTSYCGPDTGFGPVPVFTAFPALKHLCIQESLLQDYSGNPKFSDLLLGLKHLEIVDSCYNARNNTAGAIFSFLGKLKGLESLTLASCCQAIQIPVRELPSLKLLQFVWGDDVALEKLLEITSQVAKVAVTNCCSVPNKNEFDPEAKDLLDEFFMSAPNAFCGCKKGKMWGQ